MNTIIAAQIEREIFVTPFGKLSMNESISQLEYLLRIKK